MIIVKVLNIKISNSFWIKRKSFTKRNRPISSCFWKYCSMSDCHTGMSSICADATSKKIIDILSDRRLPKLVYYFIIRSIKMCLKVRFLVMDMNTFKWSYLNGFLEGVNNKIKIIKHMVYGYHNFLIFKRRIFYSKSNFSNHIKKWENHFPHFT